MPTYEYACRSCGEHLEVVQSFRDDPLTECPNCSGTLRKVYSPVGITFKGSGFYKNDSRSGSSSKTEKSEKSETAGKSEKADAAKSDSKSEPAAKSDKKEAKAS